MVCMWVLGSEVGFGGFGWVLRLFLSLVLGHVLKCLGMFLLRRLGGGLFWDRRRFFHHRACVNR
jgi:hypothetical protein